MKKSTMVILLVLAVLLIAAGLLVGNGFGWHYTPTSGSYESLGKYSADEITEVRVELLSSSLRVYKGWDDDQLEIDGSGRTVDLVSVRREGGVLVITESAPKGVGRRLTSFDQYSDYVVLWVPEDYAGTLTLSAVSGELSMNSLYAPEMSVSLTTVSGDVDVYDGRIGALSVETVSGDVWIESLKTDTVTASTVSGDIRGSVKGLHGEPKIETYTVSGDVSFE